MVRRTQFVFLGAFACATAFAFGSGMAGCQSDNSSSGSESTLSGGGGAGGGDITTGSTQPGATNGSSTSGTGTSATGTGGGVTNPATDSTITDITKGNVGQKVKVKLTGVVAMSPKFLVSQSSTSGSCLWGIFVSEPGITETQPNSGLLALSYGTDASISDGGTKAFCPTLGKTPAGDAFPDDTKPGDVLDLTGTTALFIQSACGTTPHDGGVDSSVPQYQLSNTVIANKTGTATPPTPHKLAADEVAKLASPTDTAFHNQWGGVKVEVDSVTAEPQAGAVSDQYGNIILSGSELNVPDKIYYSGYLKPNDACHSGPVYATAAEAFTSIQGFSYLDFCTWKLEPADKCLDFNPPSEDCQKTSAGTGQTSGTACYELP